MQPFHKCLSLVDDPDAESKEDLGIPIDEKYVRVRFRYADISEYLEWVEEDDDVRGTIVYTFTGRVYFIQTPLDEMDRLMDEYEDERNKLVIQNMN